MRAMALFNALYKVGIARRVGLWALIQALPDEDALRVYLRAAYMGLAGIIVGSVLTGSAIAAGLAFAYHFLVNTGWEPLHALAMTGGFSLVLIIACFALAARWFIQLGAIKDDISLKKVAGGLPSMTGLVGDALTNVAEGFVEGLTSKPAAEKKSQSQARRVRLIN